MITTTSFQLGFEKTASTYSEFGTSLVRMATYGEIKKSTKELLNHDTRRSQQAGFVASKIKKPNMISPITGKKLTTM